MDRDEFMSNVLPVAQGNPGALRVCCQMANIIGYDRITGFLKACLEMNLTGSKVWLGFKDYASEDYNVFAQAVQDRDETMIAQINREIEYDAAHYGGLVVRSGQSAQIGS